MSLHTRFLPLLAATMAFAPLSARAISLNISEASDFNLLTWGNATLLNSDTEGKAAIGGNATFSGYSVGTHATNSPTTGASLIVGGNLSAGHGQVYNGSIYVGGTYSGPGYSLNSAPGSVTQSGMGSAVPFDFAAAQTALTAKSTLYGAESANGTSVLQWSTLTLTGSDSDLNIFNISASQLSSTSCLVLNVAAGSHVLINVSGLSATFSNMGLNGFTASNVLFNFYEATSLSMSGIGVEGSILAPNANVSFVSGQMNGQLISKSFSGASWGVGELHNHTFNNQPLPPVTTPTQPPVSVPDAASTASLLALALGGIVLARRRLARA